MQLDPYDYDLLQHDYPYDYYKHNSKDIYNKQHI